MAKTGAMLATALFLTASGWGQAKPDAMDLLTHADARLFSAQSVRLVGSSTAGMGRPGQEIQFGAGVPSNFRFDYRKDGKVRDEVTVGAAIQLSVSDGVNLWTYTSYTNSYTKAPARPYVSSHYSDLTYGSNRGNVLTAALDGQEQLSYGGKTVSCYVVRATYRGRSNGAADNVTRRVWISTDDNLVLRDSWAGDTVVGGAPVRSGDLVNYAVIEWDTPIPDALFTFTPPAGSKPAGGPPTSAAAAGTGSPVLRRVAPEYSAEARAAGLQGTVSVYVEPDASGAPANIEVLHGLGLGLDQKAIEAVQKWNFKPSAGEQQLGLVADVDFMLENGAPWRVVSQGFEVEREPRQSELIEAPVLARYAAPAFACPAEGAVVLVDAEIGTNGAVGKAAPERSGPAADAVAKAIGNWHFQPGTANGKGRKTKARIEMECGNAGAADPGFSRPGRDVSAPTLVYKREPEYSEKARKAKYQGTVTLALVVDANGRPKDIQVVKSLGLGLDQKAMAAVKLWRFQPGLKNGQPVNVFATIEVNFRLL